MLIAAYLMYFSMEDAGERLGESTEEYKSAEARYRELLAQINGDMMPRLRSFLCDYVKEEREFRQEALLVRYGYGKEDYLAYKSGVPCDKNAKRIFKKVDRIHPVTLTPRTILSRDGGAGKSELRNPEGAKLLHMLLRLIPTTLCMTVTVSVMLTLKENMSAEEVLEGIFKLSSLPIIGFRGYAAGYNYTKNSLPLWMATKARLLDAFLKATA